jgi:adenosylmethionine---8-amino-7-oxononanoate aminotransferase
VVCPDFLCLSKGLTAGYLPMSAVLTTSAVYAAFYSSDVRRGFLHSHSFTGNALAAAAANASLALFASGSVWAQQALLIPAMNLGLARLASKPWASNCRSIGLIGAVSVVNPSNQQPMGDAQRSQLVALMQGHGYWMRPIGHHVYCMPPYCTTASELLGYWASLGSCIDHVILGTPWAKPAVYLP